MVQQNNLIETEDRVALLKQLEDEIKVAHTIDKKNWIRMYKAMSAIKRGELWKEWDETKSFSKWVTHLSKTAKIHETILWNRYRAGEVYDNYCKYKEKRGESITKIENLGISPDCLVFLEKINKHAPELATKITDDVINGKLKRAELKLMYESVRPTIPDYSSCDKIDHSQEEFTESKKDRVKTAQVLTTLSTMKWLGKVSNNGFKGTLEQKSDYDIKTKDRAKAFAEFAVFTGTSIKSRRIDLMCIENINHSSNEKHKVSLHGVEIKVSEYDLSRDNKFVEYSDFVDYIWLAVTPEIEQQALQVVEERQQEAGLLVVDLYGNVTKIKEAKQLDPANRAQALETAVLKLI